MRKDTPRAAHPHALTLSPALEAVSADAANAGPAAFDLYRNATNSGQAETDLLQSNTFCILKIPMTARV